MPYGRDYRYVFVAGLHRSGTSLTARLIADLPGVGAITGAPVPESEGAYLQGAIPHHARTGIPMHFATDPQQHMTEGHALDRLETRQRIEADWDPWYPPDCRWRVEKSPVNLTRMRLLQQLFPMAHFVVVIRHPEVVAAAVAKWVDAPAPALIDHWLDAHDRVINDLTYLHAAVIVRYEDLVRHPSRTTAGLAAFLDIATPTFESEIIRDGNAEYPDALKMSSTQADRAAVWGYGPRQEAISTWQTPVRHPLRNIRETADNAFGGPKETR